MPPSPEPGGRRSIYFAFQGLFMAVLVLLFVYQSHEAQGWGGRLAFLVTMTAASLAAVQLASEEDLRSWWLQTGLFLGDAALASLTLHWAAPAATFHFYLLYFLIIFGTALTRDLGKSLMAAGATSLLFLIVTWTDRGAFPQDTGFWLRVVMLWTSAPLLAILSRDTEQARADQERKYRDRLIQLERLATLGEVAGEVAHRIKGPLTTIMVNAEVLAHRHAKAPDVLRELGEIRDEAQRCKDILKSLLDLGRIEEMDFAPLDLAETVRLAVRQLEPQARAAGVSLEAGGLDGRMPARGDHVLLQSAVAAVLQNAVDASADLRRPVTIRAGRALSAGGWLSARGGEAAWEIVVEDRGAGIAEADLERVFTPFFTTKAPEGTGLGLSAALRILQKHGGTIEARSEGPGRGARFTLRVPEAPAA